MSLRKLLACRRGACSRTGIPRNAELDSRSAASRGSSPAPDAWGTRWRSACSTATLGCRRHREPMTTPSTRTPNKVRHSAEATPNRPVRLNFDGVSPAAILGKSEVPISMLMDLTLPLSIELGRTRMTVQDILRLGRGRSCSSTDSPANRSTSTSPTAGSPRAKSWCSASISACASRGSSPASALPEGRVSVRLVAGRAGRWASSLALPGTSRSSCFGGLRRRRRRGTRAWRSCSGSRSAPSRAIAVIRVGERLVAVSVGEGGIRRCSSSTSRRSRRRPRRTAAATARGRSRDFRDALGRDCRRPGCCVVLIAGGRCATARCGSAAGCSRATATKAAAPGKPATHACGRRTALQAGAAAPRRVDERRHACSRSSRRRWISASATERDGLRLSGTVGVVVMMGLLTLLPTLLLMMTGFTQNPHRPRTSCARRSAPRAHRRRNSSPALALLLTGLRHGADAQRGEPHRAHAVDGRQDRAGADAGARREAVSRVHAAADARAQDIETFVRMSAGHASRETIE